MHEAYDHGLGEAHRALFHANVDHIKIQKLRDERRLWHAENKERHEEEH
jgi:hypothetical protein